jgi:leucyl/phenylalanyl-tRNA--protein transferase
MDGTELTPWLLRYAYSHGAFPMAQDDGAVEWFKPIKRALLPLDGIHVSHSLGKVIRSGKFEIRFDSAFEAVMRGCLRPGDNWISEELIRAYTQAFHEGWAHCAECWSEGELVGGVYGLALGGMFAAESMFHRETDASKVALWALVEECRSKGFIFLDAQLMNPHLRSLGAFEIDEAEFEVLMARAANAMTPWSAPWYRQ